MAFYQLWLRSEWRRRWLSLLGVAVLVGVAGGAVLMATAGARRADSAFDRFYERVQAPTLFIQAVAAESGDLDRFDPILGELDRIAAVPGVERVQPLAYMAVGADPHRRGYFAIASVGDTSPTARSGLVIAGRALEPTDVDAVVVNEVAAADEGISIGDRIVLQALSPEQASIWLVDVDKEPASTREVEVVGIVRNVEDVSDAPEPYLVLPEGFYRQNHDRIANCICMVMVRTEPGATAAVAEQLAPIVAPYGMAVAPADALERRISQAVSVEVNALRIGAVVAAIAGLLLLVLAMLRQAADAVDEVRVRRSLGLGPRNEAIGAALVTMPAAALGVLTALVVAVALSPLLPQGRARRAEPDAGLWWDRPVLLVGAFVIVVVVVLVAAVVGWATARRVAAPVRAPAGRSGGLAMLPPPALLGVGFATDPGRDRLRLSAWSGLTGVAFAVGAIVAVATIRSSTDHLVSTPRLFGASYDLIAEADGIDRVGLAERAAGMEGVEQVAIRSSFGGASFVASGPGGNRSIDPDAYQALRGEIGPVVTEGRRPGAADEVLLGPGLARALGVGVGEEVAVVGPGAAEVRYRVVGLGVDAGFDELDTRFLAQPDGLLRLCDLVEDGDGCELIPGASLFDVADGQAGAAARDALVAQGAVPVPVPSIVGNLDDVGAVPVVLAVLLVLLGLAGLVHGLLVALRRRRRDLGIVRALGFTPGQAASALRWQAGTIAAGGAVVGMVFGAVAGRVLWGKLAGDIGALIDVRVPPATWALPFAAIAVAIAVAYLPGRRAAHLRPSDALRSE